MTENPQRTLRGLAKDPQRIHKGFADDSPSEAVADTGFDGILLAFHAPHMGFKSIHHKTHASYTCVMKDLHKTDVKHTQ